MSAASNIIPTKLNAEIVAINSTDDIARLLEIELESFEFPWSYSDFDLTLRQKNIHGRKIQIYHIDKPLIVGYVIYQLEQFSIEILNLSVAPSYRRNGLGSQALRYVVDKLGGGRRYRANISVMETNLAAQLFLRENGFRVRKICKQYYKDILDDMYLFSITLNSIDNTLLSVGE